MAAVFSIYEEEVASLGGGVAPVAKEGDVSPEAPLLAALTLTARSVKAVAEETSQTSSAPVSSSEDDYLLAVEKAILAMVLADQKFQSKEVAVSADKMTVVNHITQLNQQRANELFEVLAQGGPEQLQKIMQIVGYVIAALVIVATIVSILTGGLAAAPLIAAIITIVTTIVSMAGGFDALAGVIGKALQADGLAENAADGVSKAIVAALMVLITVATAGAAMGVAAKAGCDLGLAAGKTVASVIGKLALSESINMLLMMNPIMNIIEASPALSPDAKAGIGFTLTVILAILAAIVAHKMTSDFGDAASGAAKPAISKLQTLTEHFRQFVRAATGGRATLADLTTRVEQIMGCIKGLLSIANGGVGIRKFQIQMDQALAHGQTLILNALSEIASRSRQQNSQVDEETVKVLQDALKAFQSYIDALRMGAQIFN